MSATVPQDLKDEDFQKYLDKAGVLELVSKSLVKLYEEPEKPTDALEYLRNNIGGTKADKQEISKLASEIEELKKKVEEMEKKETDLMDKLKVLSVPEVASKATDETQNMAVAEDVPAEPSTAAIEEAQPAIEASPAEEASSEKNEAAVEKAMENEEALVVDAAVSSSASSSSSMGWELVEQDSSESQVNAEASVDTAETPETEAQESQESKDDEVDNSTVENKLKTSQNISIDDEKDLKLVSESLPSNIDDKENKVNKDNEEFIKNNPENDQGMVTAIKLPETPVKGTSSIKVQDYLKSLPTTSELDTSLPSDANDNSRNTSTDVNLSMEIIGVMIDPKDDSNVSLNGSQASSKMTGLSSQRSSRIGAGMFYGMSQSTQPTCPFPEEWQHGVVPESIENDDDLD